MNEAQTRILSVRAARTRLAEIVSNASNGDPTLLTRNGAPVAAIVSLKDFELVEEVLDQEFSRRADAIIREEAGRQPHSMAEIIADIFDPHRPNTP